MAGEATIVPRFNRDDFGPGDAVEGVLEVREPHEKLRRLSASLRYLDRSPSYAGAVTHDSVESLHEGPLAQGQEIPFSLRMPADALPGWDQPATAEMGTLFWALVTEADIARGLDFTTTHAVPVTGDAAVWRGPEPSGEGSVQESVKRWDVAIDPDRWSLRRGESLSVGVEIGKPAPDRESLEVGLMCQADYDVEVRTVDSEGDETFSRETRSATLFEDWPELETTAPSQRLEFQVPGDGPFSYDGSAFGFRWFVVAREARRLRSDPRRAARLQILP